MRMFFTVFTMFGLSHHASSLLLTSGQKSPGPLLVQTSLSQACLENLKIGFLMSGLMYDKINSHVTFCLIYKMSLVRHVVRSAVCVRLTLQQSARLHSVCSRSSLLDTWAQRTPRITSWSIVRCYAAKKKDKDKKKQRGI